MKLRILKSIMVTICASLLIFPNATGCRGTVKDADTSDFIRPTPPAEYALKTNPLANDGPAAEAGQQVFAANCVSCHGPQAMGDGPAASSLNPKPKPLALEMNSLQDKYLFWRISEGGAFAPFVSAMPAWKSILSEDEIWQVITFLRTLQK